MAVSGDYQILRFGVFELSLATEELRKAGTVIHLSPQPFRLLAFLASRAGQIVTREEIEQQLWSDESDLDFERRINQCIKQIRAALNDNATQPVYIETLRLHGYRFLVPVVMKHSAAPPPKITISDSSGLERDLAARVMARIQASSTKPILTPGAPAMPGTSPASAPAEATMSTSNRKIRLAVLVGAAVLLALMAYLLYRHSQRSSLPQVRGSVTCRTELPHPFQLAII